MQIVELLDAELGAGFLGLGVSVTEYRVPRPAFSSNVRRPANGGVAVGSRES
jgi:hypothetical protein